MHSSRDVRRGITVLEVLIAIGILAIGLVSVAAIIPAAGSQSARAVILDRAAVHAANVLADAATFGLLRQSGTTWASLNASGSAVVVDLAGTQLTNASSGTARNAGVFSTASSGIAPIATVRLLLESRDDVVVVTPAAAEEDPPTNFVADGARGYTGRITSLLCLSETGSGNYRASVVVFHGRDPGTTAITGTLTNSALTFTPPADRTATDVVRPGVVLWEQSTRRFHQTMSVSPNADGSALFVTLGSGTALTAGPFTVQILPDAVGLAERIFTAETGGGFIP